MGKYTAVWRTNELQDAKKNKQRKELWHGHPANNGSGAWMTPALERLTSWNLMCMRIIAVQRSMSTRIVALPFCPDAIVLPLAKFKALPTR